MKKEVGLWIDHRKAVIVTIENDAETSQEIQSNMEKHVRFSGKSNSGDPSSSQGSTAEDVRDRHFDNHLESYYTGILSFIRDADSILIFGPGEAKGELESLLKHEHLEEKIVGVETEDKMTDNQISAKVRDRFQR